MKKLFILLLILSSCGGGDDTLKAVDVYGNFTDKGFTLERNGGNEWTCKKTSLQNDMIVQILGNGPDKIESIKGTFLCYDGDLIEGKQFISYLASTPYPGANPQQAHDWVISNWGKNADTRFGKAEYALVCNESNSILTINFIQ